MQRDPILGKMLAVGIIALFVGTSIIPSSARVERATQAQPRLQGDILYVGGSGPGNYSRIQDAIDNASDGDTVFVYHGTYHELVDIDKAVHLIGEDRNITVIDGDYSQRIIYVTASDAQISRFTIQHSGHNWEGIEITSAANFTIVSDNTFLGDSFGLVVYQADNTIIERNTFVQNDLSLELQYSNRSTVSGNLVQSCNDSMYLSMSTGTTISGNTLTHNREGLFLRASDHTNVSNNMIIASNDSGIIVEGDDNIITGNSIHACSTGITIEYSSNNVIQENSVDQSHWGICLSNASSTNVFRNRVTNNSVGILLLYSNSNQVSFTTFQSNNRSAFFIKGKNSWDQNYWDRPRVLPKPILGASRILVTKNGRTLFIPQLQFDWHPVKQPPENAGRRSMA